MADCDGCHVRTSEENELENFTPQSALAGGMLIGLAACLLLGVSGRIAGISGIVGGLLSFQRGDRSWRVVFILGLLCGPLLYAAATGAWPVVALEASVPVTLLAGFLVGIGTRLGNGCTSGHGICGLARLSRRSAAATATFMGVAVVTVYVLRHVT
ncbi:MAG: YeeE/YedE family protein [Gammaproteobacteria bacterium]|nr:YeeE/YedE family protein [Gammaproteobacteria bacterium]